MILSVTTVKDSLANVERFVARNVAGGIDHLVVFADAPQPEVEEFLGGLPHVTCVPAYGRWWKGRRPDGLNDRQRDNASLTAQLATALPAISWVFHIDGDEAVRLDHDVLAAVGPAWQAVSLAPLEVVSRGHDEGEPTLFKRLLQPDELALLASRGVITDAVNGSYFRGHLRGKIGVRPEAGVRLGIHQAVDAAGERLDPYAAPGVLRVLHFESPTPEEFARKWLALQGSGVGVGHRQKRERVARTVATLIEQDLSESELRARLLRLYERTAVDDVDTLVELGLLEHVDPMSSVPTATPMSDADRGELRSLLDALQAPTKWSVGARAELKPARWRRRS